MLAFVEHHLITWLALAVAGLLLAHAAWRRRWFSPSALLAAGCFVFGLGTLGWISPQVAFALAALMAGVLLVKVFVVVLTGHWWAPLGWLSTAVLGFALGASAAGSNRFALEAAAFLRSLAPLEPTWMLLLLLVPPLVWASYRNLASLGPTRRLLALGLRCGVLVCIVCALAEVHARKLDPSVTVLFLWDRSLSMPPEQASDTDTADLREARIRGFINEAVRKRGAGHEHDQVGLVVFGRRPRLELPPAKVPKLDFKRIYSPVDDTYTDIAAALKLALASFPEGTGKRIVLISDGNENLGQAEEQARLARQNGVQIDVVPIAAQRQALNEVLVERVEAPPQTEKDSRLPLRVVLRSYHPGIVSGSLSLEKMTMRFLKEDKSPAEKAVFVREQLQNQKVELRQGLNVFYFQLPGSREDTADTFEARFTPERVATLAGKVLHQGLPGDRAENNRASASVMTRGERAVLLVEPKAGDHSLLVDRLRAAKRSLKVVAVEPAQLPDDPEKLATVLSRFDAVILANVPADSFTEDQMRLLRSNTHDQGAGLIMVGGHQSFGAGGWQNTEVEKALPVTMDLQSMKVEGKGGLVLMMHASEMAEGNAWQRKIAKLSIEKLSPMDMLGMLYYDHSNAGGHRWHIPFRTLGTSRRAVLAAVDSMDPGDMPDIDPAFLMAHNELTRPEYNLATKHIILISDGDHWDASRGMLKKLVSAKITCTTVCITTHGQAEVAKLAAVAQFCKGRSYHIQDPRELPAIYMKESRIVSKSFVHEGRFDPVVQASRGPTEGLRAAPPLYGLVRTVRRPEALVEVPIESPKLGEHQFPVLAHWQYGLGKGIAFTSDARTKPEGKAYWDRDWANGDIYTRFWEQTIDWALRPNETGKYLYLTAEPRDGKIRVTLHARDLDKSPITDIAEFKAGITVPALKGQDASKLELKFEQKNSGLYEAEIPADETGSYFINVQATWKQGDRTLSESVRTGVTIPYSPEFAEMESNPTLLEKLREVTDGRRYEESDLPEVARSGQLFRPVATAQPSLQTLWPWFVVAAGICLVLDVGVRRIALEPAVLFGHARRFWQRLRGQKVEAEVPEFIARLKNRKDREAEERERLKTARRFEGEVPANAPETLRPAASPAVPPAPSQPPSASTPPAPTSDDYAARLLKAKKRSIEDREKRD